MPRSPRPGSKRDAARLAAKAYSEGAPVRAVYPPPPIPLQIRPISDLRNKSQEISDLARETDQPVFITKNGREDMVVLSIAAWEDLYVYPRLLEAELDEAMGDKGQDGWEAMDELARKYGFGKYAKRLGPEKKGKKRGRSNS